MKAYIGTKIVQAEPMDDPNNDDNVGDPAPGYKVVYEDGYESWSPKEVFERCYREVTEDEYNLVSTGDES
jgi:hypothetical protein